jgi:hypothetical protein
MSDYEYEFEYTSSDDDLVDEFLLAPEDWQDWYSEELLNLWMSVVQYHEDWYIPLRRTFNEFCEFVFRDKDISLDNCPQLDDAPAPEIQAIKDHPFIKGLDWNYFFSLGTK